jgi:hypothetical protein
MMVLVQKRYPKLDPGKQATLATAALAILADPKWKQLGGRPQVALTLAWQQSRLALKL